MRSEFRIVAKRAIDGHFLVLLVPTQDFNPGIEIMELISGMWVRVDDMRLRMEFLLQAGMPKIAETIAA